MVFESALSLGVMPKSTTTLPACKLQYFIAACVCALAKQRDHRQRAPRSRMQVSRLQRRGAHCMSFSQQCAGFVPFLTRHVRCLELFHYQIRFRLTPDLDKIPLGLNLVTPLYTHTGPNPSHARHACFCTVITFQFHCTKSLQPDFTSHHRIDPSFTSPLVASFSILKMQWLPVQVKLLAQPGYSTLKFYKIKPWRAFPCSNPKIIL